MADDKCRYMQAAYPDLDAEDTCFDHEHNEATFSLALALAMACQDPDPSDEQIGWMLDDAASILTEFEAAAIARPPSWAVTKPQQIAEPGLDFALTVNGHEFVVQASEWEPAHPILRTTWDRWTKEADRG